MPNEQYLKGYTANELEEVARLSFRSGNYFTLEYIDKLDPKLFKPASPFFKSYNPMFDVCFKGNSQTLEFLRNKNKQLLDVKDQKGNTCLHYAAKGGNVDIIQQLMKDRNIDFNSQNEDGETPLHYGLRYGGYKYVKTSLLLAKHTDMTLKDTKGTEPHRIMLKDIKATFRLAEHLKRIYEKGLLEHRIS